MNREVGPERYWTAWDRGAIDRRPRIRVGIEGGLVTVVETRRLERKNDSVGLRAVMVATARARV